MKTYPLFGLCLALCIIMLYSAMSPRAYNFNKWVPNKTLIHIGIPKKHIRTLKANTDAIAHFIRAWSVTILLLLSLREWLTRSKYNYFTLVTILISAFTVIELCQLLVGRTFSFKDIAAGGLGIFFALACLRLTKAHPLTKLFR